jgi:hypothetical protein
MGLRDIIQGMKNGPRGQPQPSSSGRGGGMSRIALLGLLAYNAFKGSGGQAGPSPNDPSSLLDPGRPPRGWL